MFPLTGSTERQCLDDRHALGQTAMSMRSLMSGIASVLEEDHSRPQTTKRLVRRRRDHVAMLEGRGVLRATKWQ